MKLEIDNSNREMEISEKNVKSILNLYNGVMEYE